MNIEYLNEIENLHASATELAQGYLLSLTSVGNTSPCDSDTTDGRSVLQLLSLTQRLLALTTAMRSLETNQQKEQNHALQSVLLQRLLQFVESNFTDRELTPEKIANANGISVRYLHSLFQRAGLKASKCIWERRLQATRNDLMNPVMNHIRVSQIAYHQGFNAPAHFSRAFKSRFGLSPSKLRQSKHTVIPGSS